MTEQYQDNAEDDEFRDLLNPLRNIQAPPGLDAKCLNAASDSVDSLPDSDQSRSVTGWQTRLTVSAAIAASLLIGITTGWIARGQAGGNTNVDSSRSVRAMGSQQVPTPMPQSSKPSLVANATSSVEYQEDVGNLMFVTQETYLCGVGRIHSKSEFLFAGESQ